MISDTRGHLTRVTPELPVTTDQPPLMTQGAVDTRRNTDLSQRRKRKASNMGNLIKPQAKKNVSRSFML